MDKLSEVLNRFSISAGVFFSGNLCGLSSFEDPQAQEGHLHLLKSGQLNVIDSRGKKILLNEPSLLFYPRPTQHRLMANEEAHAEVVCATVRYGSGLDNPLAKALPASIVLPLSASPLLKSTTELLFDEAFHERSGRQVLMDRLTEIFLIHLIRHVMETGEVAQGMLAGLAHPQLSKVILAMHNEPSNAWTLEQMVELCAMSRSKFTEVFRDTVGQPPGDYLIAWRVGVAQSLLKKGKAVGWIANEVGYENASALARVFRKKTGLSPKEWLKEDECGKDTSKRLPSM